MQKQAESVPQSQPRNGEQRLAYMVQLFALYSGLMYGLTWLFYASFYDRLGVQPEDVGISVDFYLVRTAFFGFGLLVAFTFAYLLSIRFPFLRKFVEPAEDPAHRVFRTVFIVLLVSILTYIGVQFVVAKPWRDGWEVRDALGLIIQFAAVAILSLIFLGLSNYRRGGYSTGDGGVGALLATTFVMVTIVFLLVVYQAGRRAANHVIAGHEIQSPFLRVTKVRVAPLETLLVDDPEAVSASAAADGDLGTDPACMLELGSDHAVMVFVRPDEQGGFEVVQLPIEGVRIETGRC